MDKKEEAKRQREHQAATKKATQKSENKERALSQKRQRNETGKNEVFDVDSALELIKENLLGYSTEIVPKKKESGGMTYIKKQIELSSKRLCNKRGAQTFLSIARTVLNHNTITGYLPGENIGNKQKLTMKDAYKQAATQFHKYNIEGPTDAETIITTIRNPTTDAAHKARNGRGMKNTETVREETRSVVVNEDDDSEDENSGVFG